MKESINLEDLKHNATIISCDGSRFIYQDPLYKDCRLELDTHIPVEVLNQILSNIGSQAKETNRVEVPFEKIIPNEDKWWKEYTQNGIRIPIGRAGASKIQYLEFGKGTAQHALVVGKTGAGKSSLLHTLITASVLTYSPDELVLYLVDFKKGVEFKPYAAYDLPHARVIAVESEREFGLSVLNALNTELSDRGDLFRKQGINHISEYHGMSSNKLPRILLIVDEFQELFSADDDIAFQSAQILDRLVRMGRAFGIHLILCSQSLTNTSLFVFARSTVDQMAVRIALQCSEQDSRFVLGDDNPVARLLSRPGEAIYNASNGLIEGNMLFQIAWIPDEKRSYYLQNVKKMSQNFGYVPKIPQIIFEGYAPADLTKNVHVLNLLKNTKWSSQIPMANIWLGTPVAIKEPTAIQFKTQSGSNLLIVGQNDELGAGILLASVISLAAQNSPSSIRLFILNFSSIDSKFSGLINKIMSIFPHSIEVGGKQELSKFIERIEGEIKIRQNDDLKKTGQNNIFFLCYGLQHARVLRQDDFQSHSYQFNNEQSKTDLPEKFRVIIHDGPEVGVHSIIWCDKYANFTRMIDTSSLREFEMRVIFQMSTQDSDSLIGSSDANKLGPNRALYFHEEEGRIEKFQPYNIFSEQWLKSTAEQLKNKKL